MKDGPLSFSEIRHEQTQRAFFRRLTREQAAINPFPSSNLKKNPAVEEDHRQRAFEAVMEPYIFDREHIKPGTCDYGPWNNSDIGHKLHLNIEPKDVRGVSRYLSILGFNHKYLHGGDVSKGKVFTLYPGSKACADRMAQQLSRDLDPYICRPLAEDEIEYAPNIAGRFVERGLRFHKDGAGLIRGIPLLYSDLDYLEDEKNEVLVTPIWMDQAFERSFDVLTKTYGSYFYGK
jgi:hypothetical protein